MAEYNPSKIIKDGNTYNFRDTTKIPLAGSNEISGSLIPNTDGTVNLGSPSYQWNNAYIKSLTINGVACGDILTHNAADFVPISGTNAITGIGFFKSTAASQLQMGSGTSNTTGGCLIMYGSEYSNTDVAGAFRLRASKTSIYDLIGKVNGTLTWGSKNVAMQEDTIPRNGGPVITGDTLGRTVNVGRLSLQSGTNSNGGASITMYGKDVTDSASRGVIILTCFNDSNSCVMRLYPNGSWTWGGQPCQTSSDRRLKQQIDAIDDKLLDAWADVELLQFKYNDAVNEKGKDKARLHTGYVVQQIQKACENHGVDISAYGLFCHEEYPEETEEVEVEQADGTKTKERKIIREASEHYSLRYTEALIVECKYLRRCIARLTARIEELEKGNNNK